MDTNIQSIKSTGRAPRYQRHSLELKQRVVEQTLTSGMSVARIAREHGINANQIFSWRKLHREGLLGEAGTTAKLLPVTVIEPRRPTAAAPNAISARAAASRMWLESSKGCLSIEGQPDPAALRLVLEHLLG